VTRAREDLGITIEGMQVKFPDAFGKQYEKDKGHPKNIEFEYKSSKPLMDLMLCDLHY
jgi:hypothetical protein